MARGRAGAASLTSSLRGSVQEADPRVPLFAVATMEELLSESLGERRFAMTLLLAFAVVALALAAAGL